MWENGKDRAKVYAHHAGERGVRSCASYRASSDRTWGRGVAHQVGRWSEESAESWPWWW